MSGCVVTRKKGTLVRAKPQSEPHPRVQRDDPDHKTKPLPSRVATPTGTLRGRGAGVNCRLFNLCFSVSLKTFARDYQAGPLSFFSAFPMPRKHSVPLPWLILCFLAMLQAGGCDQPVNPQAKSSVNTPSAEQTQPGEQVADPGAGDSGNSVNSGDDVGLEIEVTVDFRDSQPALSGKVTLPAGATVFSALETLAKESGFKVQSKGEGETKFVVAIRDVVNLGAKGDNWTYRVNGQLGDRSAGIYQLKRGDKVAWIFGKYP